MCSCVWIYIVALFSLERQTTEQDFVCKSTDKTVIKKSWSPATHIIYQNASCIVNDLLQRKNAVHKK